MMSKGLGYYNSEVLQSPPAGIQIQDEGMGVAGFGMRLSKAVP